MFEALRRLGASTADVLFSRGTVFLEGEHDVDILTEGFGDLLSGYKVTQLGNRSEVEKEIRKLQVEEIRNILTKPQIFLFDLDNAPTDLKSSTLIIVQQWDRYCLENYLIDENILFDMI